MPDDWKDEKRDDWKDDMPDDWKDEKRDDWKDEKRDDWKDEKRDDSKDSVDWDDTSMDVSHGDDGTNIEMNMDGMEVRASQNDDTMTMTMEGDDMELNVMYGEQHDGTMISTMAKFDQYFMYSMDNFDARDNSAPECGPST